MQTKQNRSDWLAFAVTGILVIPGAAEASGAPFGFADPAFNSPRFTSRAYPTYCFSDGRGGVLWSFDNWLSSRLVGANGLRVGGVVRTTVDGIVDTNSVVGPALQDAIGVAVQEDGSILVGGRLAGDVAANGSPNYRVHRYFTNGVLDAAYQSPVFGGPPRFMTLQSDGKLVVAWTAPSGTVQANEGIPDLVRLRTDGALDAEFQAPNLAGGVSGVFAPPVVDANGLIYIAGGFTQVNGQARTGLARLQANGTLDNSFVPSGYQFSLFVRSVLLQPDGKVVIAGRLRTDPSAPYCPLVRLNPNGSIDTSFTLVSSASIGFFRARQLRATADGKLLTVSTSMARFNTDGNLDASFARLPFADSTGMPSPYVECYWFEQLADGRILIPSDPRDGVGPSFIGSQPFNGSVRLLADGTLDPTYSQPIFQSEEFPTTVIPQTSGGVLVAGSFDRVGNVGRTNLVRFDTKGVMEAGYSLGELSRWSVLKLAPLPENRYYTLLQNQDEYFTTGLVSNILARLQADGGVDKGFAANLDRFNKQQCSVFDLLLQGTHPILIGSVSAQALIDQAPVPITRFLEDGSADTTLHAVPPQTGSGVYFDGTPIANWLDVTIDNIGTLYVSDVQGLAVMPDGKLLGAIGTTTSGVSYSYEIDRLNTDGTGDDSWSPATVSAAPASLSNATIFDHWGGWGQVQATFPVRCLTCAIAQPNGKVLIGGNFTNVNGTFCRGIARLNQGGTLDQTFPLGTGPATPGGRSPVNISGLSKDSAGRTWVTGNFAQWDGIAAPGYVRLNPDCSVDTSCLPQSTHLALERSDLNAIFNGAVPGPGDNCFVFGSHLVSSEPWARALSRLVDYPGPPLQWPCIVPDSGFRVSFDTLPGVYYRVQTSSNLVRWDDWQAFQGNGQTKVLTDPAALHSPRGFYRVTY